MRIDSLSICASRQERYPEVSIQDSAVSGVCDSTKIDCEACDDAQRLRWRVVVVDGNAIRTGRLTKLKIGRSAGSFFCGDFPCLS